MKSKLKILIFVSYYLPGYKSGGPLRTIANMVEHLSNDFEFWIVTRDRDLGDEFSYPNVAVNGWNDVGNAKVFYISPDRQTLRGMTGIINTVLYDVLYLNSFFDPVFTLKLLLARRLGKIKEAPIVLAARGEFSVGALRLKRFKKRVYLYAAKWLGLYDGIYWHASSVHEAADIQKEFTVNNNRLIIALDLPSNFYPIDVSSLILGEKNDTLRVIFLSRISPMKNLDYALHVLRHVKARITFDIYGPIEDEIYWQECKHEINIMPQNILVTYCGTVLPENVSKTFALYDLFLFPTRGENYGHVIAESLCAGTPVLISDQTPWQDLKSDSLGWDLTLEQVNGFVHRLESYAIKKSHKQDTDRQNIRQKAIERMLSPEILEANRQLFYKTSKMSIKKENNV